MGAAESNICGSFFLWTTRGASLLFTRCLKFFSSGAILLE